MPSGPPSLSKIKFHSLGVRISRLSLLVLTIICSVEETNEYGHVVVELDEVSLMNSHTVDIKISS